jgi:transposase-like protein
MDRDEPVGICTGSVQGRRFDREVIVLCVRWYLSYKLSSRDLVEMMSERGSPLAHMTILRWVQRYVPVFEKQWSQYATGGRVMAL